MREQILAILNSSPAAALPERLVIESYPMLEAACRISDLRWAYQQLYSLLNAPDDQRNEQFKALAIARWERIRNTAFCYSLEPDSPANSHYRQIFTLLYPEASFFDTLGILMPDVKTLIYPTFEHKREANGSLRSTVTLRCYDKKNQTDLPADVSEFNELIVNSERAFCVPALPRQTHLLQILHRALEEQEPAFLSQFLAHNQAIAERFEIIIEEPKTIREAIVEFAERLERSGSRMTGRTDALPLAETAIAAFQRYLNRLPPDELQRCNMATNPNGTSLAWVFETHLIQNGGCVETANIKLRSILGNPSNAAILSFKPEKRSTRTTHQSKKPISLKAASLRPAGLPPLYVEKELKDIRLPNIEIQTLFFQRFSPNFYPRLHHLIHLDSDHSLTYILLHLDDSQTLAFLNAAAPRIAGLFRYPELLINTINTLRAPLQRAIFLDFCIGSSRLRHFIFHDRLFNLSSPQQKEQLYRNIQISDFFAENELVSFSLMCMKLRALGPPIKDFLSYFPTEQFFRTIISPDDLLLLERHADEETYQRIARLVYTQTTPEFFYSLCRYEGDICKKELQKIDRSQLKRLVTDNLATLASKKLLPSTLATLAQLLDPALHTRLLEHIAERFVHLGYNFLISLYWSVFNTEQQAKIVASLTDDQRLAIIRAELLSSLFLLYPNTGLPSPSLSLLVTSVENRESREKARLMQSIINKRRAEQPISDFFIYCLGLDLRSILSPNEISNRIYEWTYNTFGDELLKLTAQFPLAELAQRSHHLEVKNAEIMNLPRANMIRNYQDFQLLCYGSEKIKQRALRESWLQEIDLSPEDYADIITKPDYFASLSPSKQAALTEAAQMNLALTPLHLLPSLFKRSKDQDAKNKIFELISTKFRSHDDFLAFIRQHHLEEEAIRALIQPSSLEKWPWIQTYYWNWGPLVDSVEQLSDEVLLEISEKFNFRKSLLAELASRGDSAKVKQLCERLGAKELTVRQEHELLGWLGTGPLYYAIQSGDLNTVRYLAEKTDRFYFADRETVLHVAAKFGHQDLIDYFVGEYGVGILNVRTPDGKSAFTIALEKQKPACVATLTHYGARVEVQDIVAAINPDLLIAHQIAEFSHNYGHLPRAAQSIKEFLELLQGDDSRSWATRLFSKPSPLALRFADDPKLKEIREKIAATLANRR